MGLINKYTDFVNFVNDNMKGYSHSFVEISGVQDKNNLHTETLSLVGMIEIHGLLSLVDHKTLTHILGTVEDEITSIMSSTGVSIDFFFEGGDQVGGKVETVDGIQPSMKTSRRLDLDLEVLLKERAELLPEYISREKCYMVVWTTKAALSPSERRNANKAYKRKLKKTPVSNDGLNIKLAPDEMVLAHTPVIKQIQSAFSRMDVFSTVLSAREIVDIAVRMNHPELSPDYQPRLPEDGVIVRPKDVDNKKDVSHLHYIGIPEQVFPEPVIKESERKNYVYIGQRLHSTVIVDLPPTKPEYFQVFFNMMLEHKIPYRLKVTLVGGGINNKSIQYKNQVNNFVHVTDIARNSGKPFKKAYDALENQKDNNVVSVGIRVMCSTWTHVGTEEFDSEAFKLAEERILAQQESIARGLQSWGRMATNIRHAEPLLAHTCMLPAMNNLNLGEMACYPLGDILKMLPVNRPARIWKNGSLMLRSKDGKLLPFQPGSTMQKAWNYLIVAPMRYGKSVTQAAIGTALCTSPGIKDLPYINAIDIGPSAKGFVNLIKQALPEDKQHLAVSYDLQNDKKFAVNVGDTYPGFRFPTAAKRDFIIRFLQLLVADEEGKVHEAVADLVKSVVSETYKDMVPEKNPNYFDPTVSPLINRALQRCMIDQDGEQVSLWDCIHEKTAWWLIRDELFKAGEHRIANIAQKYAVPLLTDFIRISQTKKITDMYGDDVKIGDERVVNYFVRKMSATLDDFPIFTSPTEFELEDARVVSLNLQFVCPKGNKRQTALMYLLASEITIGRLLMHEDDLVNVDPMYRSYHEGRIFEMRESLKVINYDEWHRAEGIHLLEKQLEEYMREGPKNGMMITIASQSGMDFTKGMFGFSTGKIILGFDDPEQANEMADKLEVNSLIRSIMKKSTRPGPRGSTAIYDLAVEAGRLVQPLMLTLGPIEMWSYSTTKEDLLVKDTLFPILGLKKTLSEVSRHFPEKSCDKYIEGLMENVRDGLEDESLIKEMCKEIAEGVFDRDEFYKKYTVDLENRAA